MPVLLWLCANILDIQSRYQAFIIARNWTGLIIAWVFFVPTLAYIGGLITLEAMTFSHFILIGFALIYDYRLAKATLDKPALFCIALVFADFIASIVMGEMLRLLIQPLLSQGV